MRRRRSVILRVKALVGRLFSNWTVKLLSVAAAVVLFLFQRVGSFEERFFSVPLDYYVDEDFVVTDISAGSVRINMRGSEEEIFNVLEDDIEAYIDISDHKNEGIFRSPVLLRATGSAETVDVEMSVDPLHATVTIEERISKELEVVPQLRGYPAAGYELVQTLTTPQVIEIGGPRSRVEPIERLQTGVIELTGRKSDFTIRVPVRVDDDMVSLIGSSIVEIHGIVREIIIRRDFESVDLRYVDLSPTLIVGTGAAEGTVRITGPQLVVESLRREDLVLEVACNSVTSPGTYELPVRPLTPSGVAVVSYQPGMVNVRIDPYVPPARTETESSSDAGGTTEGETAP
jgi:YbbR domain-containing protein